MSNVVIKCLLGKISSTEADVDTAQAGINSTRWVFDVEQDTAVTRELHVGLLDARTNRPKTSGCIAPSVMPLNALAAQAHIYMPVTDLPTLLLSVDNVGFIRYRITLDMMHTFGR